MIEQLNNIAVLTPATLMATSYRIHLEVKTLDADKRSSNNSSYIYAYTHI